MTALPRVYRALFVANFQQAAQYRDEIQRAGLALSLQSVEKWDFYKAVATPDHVLTIQTADQQRFANLLLVLGVRMS